MSKKFITKDSGKRIIYKSGFNRDIPDKKPRFDLIPFEMLRRIADLYQRGAEKYGAENWKLAETQEEYNRFKASAFRHLVSWLEGKEDEDHATGTIWNIIAYEWHTHHKNATKTEKKKRG